MSNIGKNSSYNKKLTIQLKQQGLLYKQLVATIKVKWLDSNMYGTKDKGEIICYMHK